MDGKEYLDQLASTVRPEKKSKLSFMSSLPFKIIVAGIVGFILIVIVGTILSSGKADIKTQTIALKLQIDDTMTVISNYQSQVKSSDLRSSSSSLYGVLSNTSSDLQAFLQEKYNYSPGKEDKDLKEEATLMKDALEADLFEAKINGILDRIYAHKMAYQIEAIVNKESSIHNASSNEDLKSLLETSYNSLKIIYEKFSNFSETK